MCSGVVWCGVVGCGCGVVWGSVGWWDVMCVEWCGVV